MKKLIAILSTAVVVGLFLRMWHIEFGLPHSFYADEPEIAELAIKYTYEIRNIISEREYFKLIPISFVYGTFPTYLLTLATMFFSKMGNLLNLPFDKTSIYIFLRSFSSILSFFIVPTIAYLYLKIFKDKLGAIITFTLLAFNWKLIVHAHYINADILLTLLTSLSFLTLYRFTESENDTKWTTLTGILFGLAIGTKTTALLTLPLYIYIFLRKGNWKNLAGFILVMFATFIATNPFSLIFADNFLFRIWEMATKEGGLVFDSVNTKPLKYLYGLAWMITPIVFLLSLHGKWITLKHAKDRSFHIFLMLNIVFYLVFYSFQSRRVDRWLLPIIPICLIYAARGVVLLKDMYLFPV
ncbi:phospholipid carrier-dependent glycosyltransferase, partial [Patescibacteria group bacterium]